MIAITYHKHTNTYKGYRESDVDCITNNMHHYIHNSTEFNWNDDIPAECVICSHLPLSPGPFMPNL